MRTYVRLVVVMSVFGAMLWHVHPKPVLAMQSGPTILMCFKNKEIHVPIQHISMFIIKGARPGSCPQQSSSSTSSSSSQVSSPSPSSSSSSTSQPSTSSSSSSTSTSQPSSSSSYTSSYSSSSSFSSSSIFFPPNCFGYPATIYVAPNGLIVGGPRDGRRYFGVLLGTSGDDVIVGTEVNDRVRAFSGNDIICGNGGADDLRGGSGEDHIFGGPGGDDIRGGSQVDFLCGQGGQDNIRGDSHDDIIDGGGDFDTLRGRSGDFDQCFGGERNSRCAVESSGPAIQCQAECIDNFGECHF